MDGQQLCSKKSKWKLSAWANRRKSMNVFFLEANPVVLLRDCQSRLPRTNGIGIAAVGIKTGHLQSVHHKSDEQSTCIDLPLG